MSTVAKPEPDPATKMMQNIDASVKAAAVKLGLHPVPGAFDGEGWVWIWREIDEQNLEKPVRQALVRARPDSLGEGVEIQVSAGSWIPEKRRLAAGRVYFAQYFESLPDDLGSQLQGPLSKAWQGALALAARLPESEKPEEA